MGLHLDYQPEDVATPRLMSTKWTVEIDRKLHAEKRPFDHSYAIYGVLYRQGIDRVIANIGN